MAVFTWIPSSGSRMESEPRILSNKFGDGYEQRISDGINAQLDKWQLNFDVRDPTETADIRDFFKTHKGVTPFDWTPPLGSSGKYVCKVWSINFSTALSYEIAATFEQVPA